MMDKRTFIYPIWMDVSFRNWEKKGRPIPPPPAVKAEKIKDYARRFSIDILIETGTYTGNMVSLMKGVFGQIFSIELDNDFCQRAKERFAKSDKLKKSSVLRPKALRLCVNFLAAYNLYSH